MPFNAKVIFSTVHVEDLANAIIAVAQNFTSGEVYNIADPKNVTFGQLNTIIEEHFKIKTGFLSGAKNLGLKAATTMATNAINDKHMGPWSEVCKKNNIGSSVLSPFMSPESITDNDFFIDGTKI